MYKLSAREGNPLYDKLKSGKEQGCVVQHSKIEYMLNAVYILLLSRKAICLDLFWPSRGVRLPPDDGDGSALMG